MAVMFVEEVSEMDRIEKVVLTILSKRRRYFARFAQIASLKGQNQEPQYKTEKWLQAEVVEYKLVKGQGQYCWDVYIPPSRAGDRPCYFLALKCLSDSRQSDYHSVKDDLDAILSFNPQNGKPCMALVLPDSANHMSERWKYRDKMLRKIGGHNGANRLQQRLTDLRFPAPVTDGITLTWIERKQ
jgi:hypothetical protein